MKPAQLPIAALSGFMLAIALAYGQLTRPEIIIGWVDVFGDWNPHMAVFFFAAVLVYYPLARLQRWRQQNGQRSRRMLAGEAAYRCPPADWLDHLRDRLGDRRRLSGTRPHLPGRRRAVGGGVRGRDGGRPAAGRSRAKR